MKAKLLILVCFVVSLATGLKGQNLLGSTWKLTGEKVPDLSPYNADSLRLEFHPNANLRMVFHTISGDSVINATWWQSDTNRFFMMDSVLSFMAASCNTYDTSTVLYSINGDTMLFYGFSDTCVEREEFFYSTKWVLQGDLSSLPYEFNKIGINFYPNPIQDKIFFRVPPGYADVKFTLSNLLGQNLPLNINGNYMDVNGLAEGVYYVRVFDSEMKVLYAVKKLHKQ